MNESDRSAIIKRYLNEVVEQFNSGQAKEHAYRPAIKDLLSQFDDIIVVNDPKRSEHGAPDFVFLKKSNRKIIKGYAETKDIAVDLNKTEKTEQMQRYHAYSNLILTDYLEFRFYRNGEKYKTIKIGEVINGKLHKALENSESLIRELEAFLSQTPEKITNGLRLAQIMGGRARRIRDNVVEYLQHDETRNNELVRIYEMMKELLVHDLEPEKFADMYAQTLVYGLFVARYSDTTPLDFTRNEARDLVPRSNPFLLQFFDHIVGPNFDSRLAYIVDELCEIFSVSNVQEIVHRHLRLQDETVDEKDPIIHFYEDFLKEYDPGERKKMGAYYTPVPVVKYIVRQVDRILKEDFGIAKGLASDEMTTQTIAVQPYRRPGERKDRTTIEVSVPRVQILDPAVGTATFLNETIKHIYQSFKGQEGRWPAYVNENLLRRLYGFELMMAPYTIAHMKLSMTLKETGVDNLSERLGVYLTNTLEEGVPTQPDLFSFGLAEAVSEESRLAAQVKSERPVMVVMGNPPYSAASSNETRFANGLIEKYKVEPGGQIKLQERKHWLNDDYVKFIAFAEDMIEKNGQGVVAMITNNGYLDNPTFRGMRWQLSQTFDKIYIIDLHGNAKKKEIAPDGKKDENIFDIMQGVGIVLAVKCNKNTSKPAQIFHADLFGKREEKFRALGGEIHFSEITPDTRNVFFVPKKIDGHEEYYSWVDINQLFPQSSTGIFTLGDDFIVNGSRGEIKERVQKVISRTYGINELNQQFDLGKNYANWVTSHVTYNQFDDKLIRKFTYRPFDEKYSYFDDRFIWRLRGNISKNLFKDNIALCVGRQGGTVGAMSWNVVFISESMVDLNLFYRGGEQVFPLYIIHEDGGKTPNFSPRELSSLTANLLSEPSPDELLNYIYAVLHSPSYRTENNEFLRIDYPRIPIPTQAEFDRLVPLGRELRELHLMKSSVIDDYDTTFSETGECMVEKIVFSDEKVWINKTQYFGNVPEIAWNFYIGGYQPAQKWLKDRKGRKLSDNDLVHYQRIIKILLETDRIMKLIG
jgi:predicted helicase